MADHTRENFTSCKARTLAKHQNEQILKKSCIARNFSNYKDCSAQVDVLDEARLLPFAHTDDFSMEYRVEACTLRRFIEVSSHHQLPQLAVISSSAGIRACECGQEWRARV